MVEVSHSDEPRAENGLRDEVCVEDEHESKFEAQPSEQSDHPDARGSTLQDHIPLVGFEQIA